MIVVDSSALVAILDQEPDGEFFAAAIREAERLVISAVNVHETAMVLRVRHGRAAVTRMWRYLELDNDFEIAAFDTVQVRAAQTAFDRFGKGINSKAKLNMADCAAYALATTKNAPLLFKGNDFRATDVHVVSWPRTV